MTLSCLTTCGREHVNESTHPSFAVRQRPPREWLRKSRKLMHLLAIPAYRRVLLSRRVAATVEHEGQPFAESYGTVIDVGSNRGQFAVFARNKWPSARLLCFEPLPGPREVLTRLAEELGNTKVFPYALSDEDGERRMHVARSDDSSSLLAATPRQLEAFPDTVEIDELVVEVRRLDNLITEEDVFASDPYKDRCAGCRARRPSRRVRVARRRARNLGRVLAGRALRGAASARRLGSLRSRSRLSGDSVVTSLARTERHPPAVRRPVQSGRIRPSE